MDRSHRRPFKLARGPLPFVPTDIGSSLFVLAEDTSQSKNSLPFELRKRLAEIGWAQDDEVVDQKLEWAQTPCPYCPVMSWIFWTMILGSRCRHRHRSQVQRALR